MRDLVIRGPIEPADLPGLFARVCALLQSAGPDVVCCEVTGVAADAAAVDALARLRLAAARHGCELRFGGASRELLSLIAFMGLSGALAVEPIPAAAPAARTAETAWRSRGRT
jgi:ABC-type transporter Mla MlaB component